MIYIKIKNMIIVGRPKLSYENMSSRSQERAAKMIADSNKMELIYKSLKKSAKKSRKSLLPLLNTVEKSGSASQVTNRIKLAEKQVPLVLNVNSIVWSFSRRISKN